MAHKEGDDQHYLEEDNDKKMEIRTKLTMGMRVGGETHLTAVDEHCSLSSPPGEWPGQDARHQAQSHQNPS